MYLLFTGYVTNNCRLQNSSNFYGFMQIRITNIKITDSSRCLDILQVPAKASASTFEYAARRRHRFLKPNAHSYVNQTSKSNGNCLSRLYLHRNDETQKIVLQQNVTDSGSPIGLPAPFSVLQISAQFQKVNRSESLHKQKEDRRNVKFVDHSLKFCDKIVH